MHTARATAADVTTENRTRQNRPDTTPSLSYTRIAPPTNPVTCCKASSYTGVSSDYEDDPGEAEHCAAIGSPCAVCADLVINADRDDAGGYRAELVQAGGTRCHGLVQVLAGDVILGGLFGAREGDQCCLLHDDEIAELGYGYDTAGQIEIRVIIDDSLPPVQRRAKSADPSPRAIRPDGILDLVVRRHLRLKDPEDEHQRNADQ